VSLVSRDEALAHQAAEELMGLLVNGDDGESAPSNARQTELGGVPELRRALSHMLQKGSDQGRYYGCVALSYLLHGHTDNIRLFGNTPGIFQGVYASLDRPPSRGLACGLLSQLAFGDRENCGRIGASPEILERLASIMQDEEPGDQQAATCALSNCAANSLELALKIVAVPGALEGITRLCELPRAGDTVRDARTGVSAVGCIDNLSVHEEVRPYLQKGRVLAALRPIMGLRGGGRRGTRAG